MRRITRDRQLTKEEADKYDAVRKDMDRQTANWKKARDLAIKLHEALQEQLPDALKNYSGSTAQHMQGKEVKPLKIDVKAMFGFEDGKMATIIHGQIGEHGQLIVTEVMRCANE